MSKASDSSPLTTEMMERILDEIAQYSIDIEEDPTQIHLGIPYLQKVLARCRQYTNRVQFYMQKVKRYENRLRSEMKLLQLDLEFKMNEKLADDALVRKQPSIDDRKALAATMLSEEHHRMSELVVQIQDVEETYKIIKLKHTELIRTSNDIKTQRNLVKDDMLARLGGGEGYLRPQTGQDRSVPEGLAPPVAEPIDPSDILVNAPEPKALPESPLNATQVSLMGKFLNQIPGTKAPPPADPIEEDSSGIAEFLDSSVSTDEEVPEELNLVVSEPTGTKCAECKKPQFTTPSGVSCENGHGGAPALEETKEVNGPPVATGMSYEDLLA